MTTEEQQDAIIGKLTRKVESLEDTLFKNNQCREERKRQMKYFSGESFDVVWEDMVTAYQFAWDAFIDKASDRQDKNILYDQDLLEKNFRQMLRDKDFINIEQYLIDSEMPF